MECDNFQIMEITINVDDLRVALLPAQAWAHVFDQNNPDETREAITRLLTAIENVNDQNHEPPPETPPES